MALKISDEAPRPQSGASRQGNFIVYCAPSCLPCTITIQGLPVDRDPAYPDRSGRDTFRSQISVGNGLKPSLTPNANFWDKVEISRVSILQFPGWENLTLFFCMSPS
jgi:hypothetical protein